MAVISVDRVVVLKRSGRLWVLKMNRSIRS